MKRQKEKKLTNSEKKKLINAKYDLKNKDAYLIDKLSYRKKIYLLTVFRVMTDEGFDRIIPLSDKTEKYKLSPSIDMDINILDCLYTEGLLRVDPNSNIDAFIFENNECEGFSHAAVSWQLNIASKERVLQLSDCYKLIYNELMEYFPTSPEDRDGAYGLTMNIALSEVEDYLLYKCKELGFIYCVGKRTIIYIYQLLNYFSVSKIYSIINQAIDETHLVNSQSGLRSLNLGNYIAMKILEIGELAITDKTSLVDSPRIEQLQRSELSKVFYEFIHRGHDEGFFECPKKYWKKTLSSCYFTK